MASSATSPLHSSEYPAAYANYIELVPPGELVGLLEKQREDTATFWRGVSEPEGNTRHPPYTWSVKEVAGHILDCERIMGYRILAFARGEQASLPGFDENAYARVADFDSYRLSDLAAEFDHLRRSHLYMLRGLSDIALQRRGTANNNAVSVRALAYVLYGHAEHHGRILRRRLGRA